jgi:hypothetical protein
MMNAIAANRPSLDAARRMPVADLLALPAEHLALLQEDARVALRYEQRAVGARAAAGKDTGTVRFQDGTVEVVVDLPKRVDWDQPRLASLAEQIRAGGEDPGEYVEVSFKVSERAYTAWPERIRLAFEPARTVRTGKPSYRLAIMSDVAMRDSPHGPGVRTTQGGR